MIGRTEGTHDDGTRVWAQLAAPLDGAVTTSAVLARLDAVVPGEFDLTLDLLPPCADAPCAFKARLQILGVIREHVGTGATYREAASAAFLAAARMFRVGSDRAPASTGTAAEPTSASRASIAQAFADIGQAAHSATGDTRTSVACPKCGGPCHDNRATKRNPKAPDYRCKERTCTGVIWPPNSRGGRVAADAAAGREAAA